ncbi:hypothetical protein DUNSADRAFT_1889 [Dunaliella salina]|uniref:Encoded protein n=1 Tax=Dunaliella salina TaxID=3046 RepID=A0ABQ7GWF2_DUNSA|nr:hypothetical protein DUNSADRAFT_1889 [Dunaliella salina]|eukprot:KAF5838944.1 hypothetical protein DUNSADRAFT_1889 [Dunaliella salina]
MFFSVPGFPMGPPDRTGEAPKKPGMTNIARVSYTDHGLSESDIAAGEESLAYRNFENKVISDMKDSISSCSGNKKSSCGVAIEVLSVMMPESRRSLSSAHVVVTTTVTELNKSDLDSSLSSGTGFTVESTMEPDMVTDGGNGGGDPTGASAMISQQAVLAMLASLAVVFMAWA